MQSPLLAEDGDDGGAPSLSAGPPVAEESEFERLIAQKTPLEAFEEHFDNENGPLEVDYELMGLDLDNFGRDSDNRRTPLLVTPPRGPLTIACAATFSILHLALVWTSYTAETWAESRVRVSIKWQEEFLPLLNDAQETVVRSTNLMSLLQDLAESKNYVLLCVLWAVSLLLPCAFMVVSPTFVLADRINPIIMSHRKMFWNGRGTLETLMRCSLLTFFVITLLGLATSYMELQWTDTTIQAGNRACSPFAAYVCGIACAISLAVLLRAPGEENAILYASTSPAAQTNNNNLPSIQAPPPQAFHNPWFSSSQPQESHDDEPTMTLLEESPILNSPREPPQQSASSPSTPDLISENGEREDGAAKPLGFGRKVAAFQLGLLSVLLWVPAFYLPALHLSYGGLATNFLAEPKLKLYVWEIGGALWKQGIHFGTPVWILLISGTIFLVTTLVIPLLLTCLGVLAWTGDGRFSTFSSNWLYALHPANGNLVFTVALVAVIYSITPFASSLLQEETSGLCGKFHEMTGESCLVVVAKSLPGTWAFLMQSIALELFVIVTLRWSGR